MALPIWAKYMQKIYADKTLRSTISQGDFEKPAKKIDIEMDCSKYNKDLENGVEDYDTGGENQ